MKRVAVNFQQIVFSHAKNGLASPIVTVQILGTVDGLAIVDQTITVTNAEERMIGPFPPDIYSQSDGGMVYADYSSVTTWPLRR